MSLYFDFVIKETNRYTIVFRFYPEKSSMHGFHDEPAKSFREVYKVYYTWDIIKISNDRRRKPERMFGLSCDENSALLSLDELIEWCIIERKRNLKRRSFGDGSSWELTYRYAGYAEQSQIMFVVFDMDSDLGFRFQLAIPKAREFASYLETINQYMLEHSVPC